MTPPSLPTVSPEKVTPEQVEQAASELGLRQFRVQSIEAQRVLGKHLHEVGVAQVGRGIYLINTERVLEMQARVAGLIEDLAHDPGVQAKMVAAFAALAKTLNESAKGLLEAGDPKPESPQRPQIGLPPPMPTQGVFINMQGGTVKVQDGRPDGAVPQGAGEQTPEDE